MTRDYPRSERDTNKWAGAIRVPDNADPWRWLCGLPSGQAFHQIIRGVCTMCHTPLREPGEAAKHLARWQFDSANRR